MPWATWKIMLPRTNQASCNYMATHQRGPAPSVGKQIQIVADGRSPETEHRFSKGAAQVRRNWDGRLVNRHTGHAEIRRTGNGGLLALYADVDAVTMLDPKQPDED